MTVVIGRSRHVTGSATLRLVGVEYWTWSETSEKMKANDSSISLELLIPAACQHPQCASLINRLCPNCWLASATSSTHFSFSSLYLHTIPEINNVGLCLLKLIINVVYILFYHTRCWYFVHVYTLAV